MKALLKELTDLKNSDIRRVIDTRISEFERFKKASDADLFSELCFCLMTANFQAEKSIKIQDALCTVFPALPEEKLSAELRKHGHRFPNMRAKFIVEARKHNKGLRAVLDSFSDDQARRNWLVGNVKGLGMKESSHFLRNIGYRNYAIIDFHIIDKLADSGLVEKPKNKSLTQKKYVEIENILKEIGRQAKLSQAELDLYLWYAETGKVLK
jgi:N-glycosylase/DNA lyase